MEALSIVQDHSVYENQDHKTWSILFEKHRQLCKEKISKEYLDGFAKLQLANDRIVRIEDISSRLESISGWTLVPVEGLIPTKDFFYMLINKKYPITVSIRKPHEIDFSEQPDIFHDVFGHLPLLTNEKFVKFLTAYSIIALKYVNNERAVDFLGRLYWYTYEMGILKEDGEYKPYGGAIITSSEEIANISDRTVPKHIFDLDHILSTPYNPYKLQSQYFVINSFEELFDTLEHLESRLIAHLLLPDHDYTLRNFSLNTSIGKDFNNVIGFLNDIQYKFPEAISFVAGQPDENFFEIENQLSKIDLFVTHIMQKTGESRKSVFNQIGQYNKTKGIINDLLAKYLHNEENINAKGDDLLVTVGAQEAFAIIVSTICNRSKDVILVEDPSYIGVSSFAKVFGYNIDGVRIDEEGIDLKALKNKVIEINKLDKRVKALYVIPDYQNPTGACMPIGSRLKLLELAQQYNFLIIEDAVYNSFTYAQKKNPTLKSLDKYNRVIYVGSFSKSLFPGLRIGLIYANQKVENDRGETVPLVDEMVKVKAQITNNTPGITQAILGGVLLDLDCSLSKWNKSKYESYKRKRDHILKALDEYIGVYSTEWARDITWTRPDGGFFIKVTVPFEVDDQSVVESARQFKVIFCPMRYFYLTGGKNEMRLTFSNLSHNQIEAGIKQFADFLAAKVRSSDTQEVEFQSYKTISG
jgi:monomeric phenylalanine-4-hydroxylase